MLFLMPRANSVVANFPQLSSATNHINLVKLNWSVTKGFQISFRRKFVVFSTLASGKSINQLRNSNVMFDVVFSCRVCSSPYPCCCCSDSQQINSNVTSLNCLFMLCLFPLFSLLLLCWTCYCFQCTTLTPN